jgi:hypothetical protein
LTGVAEPVRYRTPPPAGVPGQRHLRHRRCRVPFERRAPHQRTARGEGLTRHPPVKWIAQTHIPRSFMLIDDPLIVVVVDQWSGGFGVRAPHLVTDSAVEVVCDAEATTGGSVE